MAAARQDAYVFICVNLFFCLFVSRIMKNYSKFGGKVDTGYDIRSAGGVCGRPAGWRILADRARLGRPGSRLPLRASVAGLGGAYRGGRPPTAC